MGVVEIIIIVSHMLKPSVNIIFISAGSY